MGNRNRTIIVLVVALVFGALFSTGALAANYPSRPITMIVPWSAGGGTDSVGRMVAVLLEKELGQPVSVVNRTGGSGAVGHTAGAIARPDGYTITMATVEITMMHWMGLTKISYKDFKPVSLVNLDPAGITVASDAPWKTYEDLEAAIKAHPGEYKASGTGRGGIWDVARAGWLKELGLKESALPWVPSQGAAPGLQELVAGGVQVVTASLPEAASLIEAGKVMPLAIMAENRDPRFPKVPTLKEKGIDWALGAWRGILVPAKTPDDIVSVLEDALSNVVKNPEFIDFMNNRGFGILYKDSDGFAKLMADGDDAMGVLMKEVGLAK